VTTALCISVVMEMSDEMPSSTTGDSDSDGDTPRQMPLKNTTEVQVSIAWSVCTIREYAVLGSILSQYS